MVAEARTPKGKQVFTWDEPPAWIDSYHGVRIAPVPGFGEPDRDEAQIVILDYPPDLRHPGTPPPRRLHVDPGPRIAAREPHLARAGHRAGGPGGHRLQREGRPRRLPPHRGLHPTRRAPRSSPSILVGRGGPGPAGRRPGRCRPAGRRGGSGPSVSPAGRCSDHPDPSSDLGRRPAAHLRPRPRVRPSCCIHGATG